MQEGKKTIAGVDEVGRGALAGPVYAAAVVLHPHYPIEHLCDSKQLRPQKRAEIASIIQEKALNWSIGYANEREIDELNIHQAVLLAMKRAVEGLRLSPDEVWIDGLYAPALACPTKTFVKGDQRIPQISAASIVAKVLRDEKMVQLAKHYPAYGFERHKGYGTKAHLEAIQTCGICPLHRTSYAPCQPR